MNQCGTCRYFQFASATIGRCRVSERPMVTTYDEMCRIGKWESNGEAKPRARRPDSEKEKKAMEEFRQRLGIGNRTEKSYDEEG